MNPSLEKYTVSSTANLIQAVERIEENRSRNVIVLKEHVVIGVLSEGDVMRALLRGTDVHTPVSEIISGSFKFLKNHNTREAFEIFSRYLITLIPIVDESFHLTGVITALDLMGSLSFTSSR